MSAGKLKITIDQGATFRKRMTWTTGDPPLPVDLTGCTARMQIRAEITDADPLITLTTENNGIVLDDVLGTIDLYISDTDTAAIEWTTGVYDLEIILANGDVRRLLYGPVTVTPEVTRD